MVLDAHTHEVRDVLAEVGEVPDGVPEGFTVMPEAEAARFTQEDQAILASGKLKRPDLDVRREFICPDVKDGGAAAGIRQREKSRAQLGFVQRPTAAQPVRGF
mgnify:CR=1 FL=1